MLTYRSGDPERPRGHALLFFRDADDPDTVVATYLVVAPIALDIGKYLPAAFAPQMATQMMGTGPAAYPLPPVPERIEEGLRWLERMAELRGDDLLDGGVLRVGEPWQALHPVTSIGTEYAERCEAYLASAAEAAPPPPEPASGAPVLDVDALLLQVMPDRDKVGRLARLTGTLRYAVDGGDKRQIEETVAEMRMVARYLPEKYRAEELIEAARSTAPNAGTLAQLFVERSYRVADEDYGALADLDRRIVEAGGSG